MFPWAQKNTTCIVLAASQPTKGCFLFDAPHTRVSLPWLGRALGGTGTTGVSRGRAGSGRGQAGLAQDEEVCFTPA